MVEPRSHLIEVTTGATDRTVTLLAPSAVPRGTEVFVIKTDAGVGRCTVAGTIDGGNAVLTRQHQIVQLSAGASTSWHPVAGVAPRLNVRTETANYTTVAADDVVLINSAVARTITLVAAATAGAGKVQIFKNIGTAEAIIDGNAAETIDGNLTARLLQNDGAQLVTNGSNWFLI